MAEPKFWMVYVDNGRTPSYKHTTEVSARKEAERLARTTHASAYVLESMKVCKVKEVDWETLRDRDVSSGFFASLPWDTSTR